VTKELGGGASIAFPEKRTLLLKVFGGTSCSHGDLIGREISSTRFRKLMTVNRLGEGCRNSEGKPRIQQFIDLIKVVYHRY